MTQAILFDLGGTVLSENSYNISSGYSAIAHSLSPNASLEKLMASTDELQNNTHEFSLLNWIDEHLDKSNPSSTAADIEMKLWDNTASLSPKPDIAVVLDYLNQQNIRVAAISNAIFSSVCMRTELDKYNLGKYFEFIISSADIGIRKPDRRIFDLALSKLNMKADDIWYIGDNWEADILGATSADMTAVWIKDNFHDHDNTIDHYKLTKWSDFKKLWQENNITE